MEDYEYSGSTEQNSGGRGRGEEKCQLCDKRVSAGVKIKVPGTLLRPGDCGAEEETGGRAGGARGEDDIEVPRGGMRTDRTENQRDSAR